MPMHNFIILHHSVSRSLLFLDDHSMPQWTVDNSALATFRLAMSQFRGRVNRKKSSKRSHQYLVLLKLELPTVDEF
jgi:hypothetical protein